MTTGPADVTVGREKWPSPAFADLCSGPRVTSCVPVPFVSRDPYETTGLIGFIDHLHTEGSASDQAPVPEPSSFGT
jgi:hypothetical protein